MHIVEAVGHVLRQTSETTRNVDWIQLMKHANHVALGLGVFLSFWANSPQSVAVGSVAATLLIFVDTVFGVACACIFKEFRSRTLRERLIAKFLYYSLFIFVSYILGALLTAYWMMNAAWYTVSLVEVASIGETLTRLHIRGGKRFGPLEKALQMMAGAMGQAAQAALPNGPVSGDEKPTKEKKEAKP